MRLGNDSRIIILKNRLYTILVVLLCGSIIYASALPPRGIKPSPSPTPSHAYTFTYTDAIIHTHSVSYDITSPLKRIHQLPLLQSTLAQKYSKKAIMTQPFAGHRRIFKQLISGIKEIHAE